MKQLAISVLLTFISFASFGHSVSGLMQDYGNVRVYSYRETEREDFRKAFIIGQLAQQLAKALHYTEPISLYCWLGLLKDDSLATTYHVSFQNHSYNDNEGEGTEKLLIKQEAKHYDVIATLKLVEYAILYKKDIKQQQQWIKSTLFADRGEEKLSISNDVIKAILAQPTSVLVQEILRTRINRPLLPDDRIQDIRYYWQDNQYHIYRSIKLRNETELREVVLLTLPNIHQFADLDLVFLVFDQVDSFYYININRYDQDSGINKVSKRHVIKDIGKIDFGKKVTAISNGDVSIYFSETTMGRGKRRLLLYFHETDTLVQDVYTALGIEPSDPNRRLREAHENPALLHR